MLPVRGNEMPDSEYSGSLKTELTLALPGDVAAEAPPKCGGKRSFLETVELKLGSNYEDEASVSTPPPPSKAQMFTCLSLTICNVVNERKIMDNANGTEYVPTYEDRDGDWMLVGDVPWKMFAESCKRLRLIKSSEAIGLGITRGGLST
ncbi:Iaa15p [Orobanche hederae]